MDAFSGKTLWVILRKLDTKLKSGLKIFVSNFLKMIHKVMTENASIERTCLLVQAEQILCES